MTTTGRVSLHLGDPMRNGLLAIRRDNIYIQQFGLLGSCPAKYVPRHSERGLAPRSGAGDPAPQVTRERCGEFGGQQPGMTPSLGVGTGEAARGVCRYCCVPFRWRAWCQVQPTPL